MRIHTTEMLSILHSINQAMYKDGCALTLGQLEFLAKRLPEQVEYRALVNIVQGRP